MNEIEEFADLVKTKGLGSLFGLEIKPNESEEAFQERVNYYKECHSIGREVKDE